MNLNSVFQNLVGEKSRSLFVYSDVRGSNVVENQVTDLLCEIFNGKEKMQNNLNHCTFNISKYAKLSTLS